MSEANPAETNAPEGLAEMPAGSTILTARFTDDPSRTGIRLPYPGTLYVRLTYNGPNPGIPVSAQIIHPPSGPDRPIDVGLNIFQVQAGDIIDYNRLTDDGAFEIAWGYKN